MFWLIVLCSTVVLVTAQEDSCGVLEEVGATGGYVESPGYATYGTYKAKTKCRYHLNAPAGQNLALRFDPSFDLEISSVCRYDYIAVYKSDRTGPVCDLNNSGGTRILGPICSYNAANDIVIEGSSIVVEFCTDVSTQERGFHLAYEATTRSPTEADCQKVTVDLPFDTSTYNLTIPRATGNCFWEFTAPAGRYLQLDAVSYDLSSGQQDYINVLDVKGDGTLELLKSFYAGGPPAKFRSNGNRTVIYISSISGISFGTLRVSVARCSGQRSACPNDPFGDDCAFEPSMICDGKVDCPKGADESLCSDRCGTAVRRPVLSVSPKIVHGQTAAPNSWPWQVVMYIDNQFACGGSIIHPRFVLTAAHCCTYRNILNSLLDDYPASYVTVEAGVHNRVGGESSARRYTVRRVTHHPLYTDSPPAYDFCLLETSQDMDINNSTITPVCMPTVGQEVPVGSTCYVTGWGETDQRDQGRSGLKDPVHTSRSVGAKADSAILQQIDLEIISQQDCQDDYADTSTIGADTICAQGYGDSCQGDSGGPMVCATADNPYRFQLRGVVSWAFGCADERYAGVNGKVSHVLPWIIGKVGDAL